MSNRTSRAKAREKRNAGLNVETNDETNDETNAETNAETTVQPNPVENTNSNPGVRLSVGTFVVESWKIMCVSVGPLVAAYFSTSTKVMIAVNLGYTFLKMLQSIAAKPKKKAPLQYVWSLLKFGSFYSILSGVVNTVKVNVKEIAAASFVAGYGMHDIVTLLNPFAWLKADFPEPMFPGPMAVLFNQRWDHAGAFPRMEKEFGAHGGGDLSSFDPKTKSWFQYIIKRVIYQQKDDGGNSWATNKLVPLLDEVGRQEVNGFSVNKGYWKTCLDSEFKLLTEETPNFEKILPQVITAIGVAGITWSSQFWTVILATLVGVFWHGWHHTSTLMEPSERMAWIFGLQAIMATMIYFCSTEDFGLLMWQLFSFFNLATIASGYMKNLANEQIGVDTWVHRLQKDVRGWAGMFSSLKDI